MIMGCSMIFDLFLMMGFIRRSVSRAAAMVLIAKSRGARACFLLKRYNREANTIPTDNAINTDHISFFLSHRSQSLKEIKILVRELYTSF